MVVALLRMRSSIESLGADLAYDAVAWPHQEVDITERGFDDGLEARLARLSRLVIAWEETAMVLDRVATARVAHHAIKVSEADDLAVRCRSLEQSAAVRRMDGCNRCAGPPRAAEVAAAVPVLPGVAPQSPTLSEPVACTNKAPFRRRPSHIMCPCPLTDALLAPEAKAVRDTGSDRGSIRICRASCCG